MGAGARGGHPHPADRADALQVRRLGARRRPHRLRHADRPDLAGLAAGTAQPVFTPEEDGGRTMTALLETRGVWQRFGGLVANSDVSISVGRGEIVGLIGPNGAGKSTLFNLIAGVLPPTQGSILFDGEDVTRMPAAVRCQRGIGRTFQVVKSFETMTVIDNVIVGALVRNTVMREARRKAHEVLEFTGLAARADVLASDLVPAEKRRLEVARALATEPKLLLLDEVLTGLTPTEAQTGVALVRKVRDAGITVLMVEHVMEIVMPLVDRAIVLDLGKVLVEGKPTEVVRDPKVIKAYLGDRHAVGA
nr:high-affinity branched-chain amino acid transport ATP-binding protein BraF [Bradyrhizobium sp. DOA9]